MVHATDNRLFSKSYKGVVRTCDGIPCICKVLIGNGSATWPCISINFQSPTHQWGLLRFVWLSVKCSSARKDVLARVKSATANRSRGLPRSQSSPSPSRTGVPAGKLPISSSSKAYSVAGRVWRSGRVRNMRSPHTHWNAAMLVKSNDEER